MTTAKRDMWPKEIWSEEALGGMTDSPKGGGQSHLSATACE